MRRGRVVMAGGLVAAVLAVGPPVAVAASAPAARAGQSPLTSGAARSLARNVTRPVIIVFKDQVSAPVVAGPQGPAEAIAGVQRPVLSELARTGAQRVHPYQLLDAVSAVVSPGEASRLAADPSVAGVVADEAVPVADAVTAATNAAAAVGRPAAPLPGACAAPGHVQLNPEALQAVAAKSQVKGARTAASLGYTGAGVKVAWLADGLDTNSPEFVRPNGTHVFVDYQDFSGSGTAAPTGGAEAFLDAGSIAAQGAKVYDVSRYSDLPLSKPCDIRIEGVAPGASLVGLDVFGNDASYVGSSVFLEAVDWAVTHDHVNVINESFGSNPFPDAATLDLIKNANDAAVAAGVTVTVSSGDSGITDTVGSPATDPRVISVGASTTYRADAQDGYGGARLPGVKGWLSNNISSLSSGGVTEAGRTIDVVAPGELNWLPCSPNVTLFADCTSYAGHPTAFQSTGGTSESSPITAGVAALVIQAYRGAHGGRDPVPAVVKQIITSTANPLGAPADQQGAGILDAYQAVLAARSYNQTAAHSHGATVLDSPSQLDVSAPPATTEHLRETVKNNGATTQTVWASSRTMGAYSRVGTATVTLSDTAGSHYLDWSGVRDNARKVTFTVPAGKDRLNASIAFQTASSSLDARVRLTLVDPAGRLAAYSVPQGDGNFGDVQVARPAAGRWTGYIFSRDSADGGTTGQVVFGAAVANWRQLGTVSPRFRTLTPGGTGVFTVVVPTPATPGDRSASLLLSSTAAGKTTGTTSVPIILRSLIPAGSTRFTGILTGGNGRASFTGQTAYYQIRIPAGRHELNASITLAGNPNNPFTAELVDPQGQAVSIGSNETLVSTVNGPVGVPSTGAELHALSPAGGTWDVVIDFYGQVSGTTLSEPYTVAVDQTAVATSTSGLPDSTSTRLRAGQAVQATVTVHNSGTAPQAYFVDTRLPTDSTVELSPLGGSATTALPNSSGVGYIVPTETTNLVWSATSTVPLLAELFYAYGDPDLLGAVTGRSASGSFPTFIQPAQPVAQGLWGLVPQEIGADGKAGLPAATATTAVSATTASFDPAITSSTGDLWLASVDPNATMSAIVVGPGQSAQIPLTITPSGPVGTTVSGTLYVDDAELVILGQGPQPQADQVAAIPYRYTIGS